MPDPKPNSNEVNEQNDDRLRRLVGLIELERNDCIRRREEKVALRDYIGAVGWDGRVQGLRAALAILRQPNKALAALEGK